LTVARSAAEALTRAGVLQAESNTDSRREGFVIQDAGWSKGASMDGKTVINGSA
jgi:hypothetical protein